MTKTDLRDDTTLGAIRLERWADQGWNTRAASSEYAIHCIAMSLSPIGRPRLAGQAPPRYRVVGCLAIQLLSTRRDAPVAMQARKAARIRLKSVGMVQIMAFLRILFGSKKARPHAIEAQTALELSEDSFRLLAENSADVIMRVDRSFLPTYVSPSSLEVLGWKPEEMLGRSSDLFVVPEDLPALASASQRALTGEGDNSTETFRMRRKDGSIVWVEGRTHAIRDRLTGLPGDVVIIMRDITDRKTLELQLSALALTDGLTGLANRRAFDQTLEQEWGRTLREGTPLSLLLVDLDHFKGLNDQYGHQVGDDCLRAIAIAIEKTLRRPGDIAARYGGEEIAVILPSTEAAGALLMAEQIRSGVEALRLPNLANPEGGGWVTASVGAATAISRMGGTMKMPEALLTAADTALYKAKRGGRNCVATSVLLAPHNRPID